MTGPDGRDAAGAGAADAGAPTADGGRFAEEIRRDERFETRLAVKALIAVAIVAVLIVSRLIGF